MVSLCEKRAKEIVRHAEAELEKTGEEFASEDEAAEVVEARRERRREADALMVFLRKPAKKGAVKEDFLVRVAAGMPRSNGVENGLPSRKRSADGEIKLHSLERESRTPYNIRKTASSALRVLVMDGTTQLEDYDAVSTSTLDYYKKALARRTSTSEPSARVLPSPDRVQSGNINNAPQRSSIPGFTNIPDFDPFKTNDSAFKANGNNPPVNAGVRITSAGKPLPRSAMAMMEDLARQGSR